jgi:hypothetical protein
MSALGLTIIASSDSAAIVDIDAIAVDFEARLGDEPEIRVVRLRDQLPTGEKSGPDVGQDLAMAGFAIYAVLKDARVRTIATQLAEAVTKFTRGEASMTVKAEHEGTVIEATIMVKGPPQFVGDAIEQVLDAVRTQDDSTP